MVVVEYKTERESEWIDTGIVTHASEAWVRWVEWRLVNGITDSYAVQIREEEPSKYLMCEYCPAQIKVPLEATQTTWKCEAHCG